MTEGFARLERQLVAALQAHLATGAPPDVPEAGVLLWRVFAELAGTRTWHASGPNPIAFGEIDAWARRGRWPLEPRHVRVIRALDDAWCAHVDERRGAGGKPSRKPSAELTPALFDALIA